MEMQPLTVASAGYLMVLTSLSPEVATAEQVLATYRLRWQVELAFKRLKTGLGIHRLVARDPAMARSWLLAHLILALMIEDATGEVLDSPPSAVRWREPAGFALAPAYRLEARAAGRRSEAGGDHRTQGRRSSDHPAYLRSAAPSILPISVGSLSAPALALSAGGRATDMGFSANLGFGSAWIVIRHLAQGMEWPAAVSLVQPSLGLVEHRCSSVRSPRGSRERG